MRKFCLSFILFSVAGHVVALDTNSTRPPITYINREMQVQEAKNSRHQSLSVGCAFATPVPGPWDQSRLEDMLCHGFHPCDYYPDGEPPDVPHRNRNALPEFHVFFENSGWTTNQLIQGLIAAVTNNLVESKWNTDDGKNIAGTAIWKLSEINDPAVTNFFRWHNDSDETIRCGYYSIPGMFYYTNLEPDVLAYLRTLCVRTNAYDRFAPDVMHYMFETLNTMPDELKPSATNRVAKYMHFAINHATDSQGWQDEELSRFLPSYSNSIQRLDMMRYVSVSAANAWERANASNIVQILSSIPTNELNNIEWIAE